MKRFRPQLGKRARVHFPLSKLGIGGGATPYMSPVAAFGRCRPSGIAAPASAQALHSA